MMATPVTGHVYTSRTIAKAQLREGAGGSRLSFPGHLSQEQKVVATKLLNLAVPWLHSESPAQVKVF